MRYIKPEITTQVQGGLGNQLFIYAQARAMADRTLGSLTIDPSLLSIDKVYKRPYLLDNFNIRSDEVMPIKNDINLKMARLSSKLFRNRFVGIGNWIYEPDPPKFLPEIFNWKRKIVKLNGYWQSENYFKDNKLQIANDLRLLNEEYYSKTILAQTILKTTNSVFLHFRSYREVPGKSDGSYALPVEYFKNAIQKVQELVPNPHFFLFSDDHEWVSAKLNLAETIAITPVSNHDETIDSTLFEFYLMTLCNHGIVANSSYSWWSGWLCEQKNIDNCKDCLMFCPTNVSNPNFYPKKWDTIKY